jgi:hypothetical protein
MNELFSGVFILVTRIWGDGVCYDEEAACASTPNTILLSRATRLSYCYQRITRWCVHVALWCWLGSSVLRRFMSPAVSHHV